MNIRKRQIVNIVSYARLTLFHLRMNQRARAIMRTKYQNEVLLNYKARGLIFKAEFPELIDQQKQSLSMKNYVE